MATRTAPIRVIHYGLGPIGLGIARILAQRPGYEIVSAVDLDPEKAGKDLGTLLGGSPWGVPVSEDEKQALAQEADVVVHATRSHLPEVLPQLTTIVARGLNVISTCEELSYPWWRYPEESRRLDHLAREHGVTVVGAGVNPGFAMDVLPILLTAPCKEVRAIRVERVVDVSLRREPLQRKVGLGLSSEEFHQGVQEGRIGHVGLEESVAMIAAALGWNLQRIDHSIEPVLEDGRVKGLHQVARGVRDGSVAILLDLTMVAGTAGQRDAVWIEGDPPLRVEVDGGIPGDIATCAIVANAIPAVLDAPPGLLAPFQIFPVWKQRDM
ncbi:MAG: dihydrodipicolinate reductase [Armatimonadota bacterium]|nr:dihydrodipicolinate reductase [Armatimonadota bacterium]MDR5702198.1 dihydrodipicolinate reductase [Armatimonadota bacterium]